MSRIPIVSGKDTIRALTKIGYYIRSQRGSHVHLRHSTKRALTIPNHKTIAKGTLRAILKEAKISITDFLKLL
jgi:predicted RNA binding protein YcfA (HicA-like mRNA interferase family)